MTLKLIAEYKWTKYTQLGLLKASRCLSFFGLNVIEHAQDLKLSISVLKLQPLYWIVCAIFGHFCLNFLNLQLSMQQNQNKKNTKARAFIMIW